MLEIIRIVMSFVGAFAFSLLFNIRGKRLVFAAFGGLLCGVVFFASTLFSKGEIFCYFTAACAVTVYAEIGARLLKAPATSFLSPGLIPLVPGGNMYFAMLAALHGDLQGFFENGADTVYIALSIAAGILVISPLKLVFGEIFQTLLKRTGEKNIPE